jgi:hypothetical protein
MRAFSEANRKRLEELKTMVESMEVQKNGIEFHHGCEISTFEVQCSDLSAEQA